MIQPLFELPAIIEKLKQDNIYTIVRVIALKDVVFAQKNSTAQLMSKNKTAKVEGWVDPTNQEVLDYNREVISDILKSGVDEINLDFIRYPTKPSDEFLGVDGAQKIENVTNFVKMVRDVIDEEKPNTILSVDTFAVLPWDNEMTTNHLGQNIKELAKYADIIAPMLYPNTFSADNPNYLLKWKSFEYSTVFLTLQKYAEVLGDDAKKLRPWIQGYHTTKQKMVDQIQAVYDAGFCGFTIWDIENFYADAYNAMAEVEIPENCKN